jgi:GWxTD domain-containing protein
MMQNCYFDLMHLIINCFKTKKRFWVWLLAMAMVLSSKGVDITRMDMSYLYEANAPIKVLHRVSQSDNLITVYLQIDADSLELWDQYFYLQRRYDDEEHQTILPKISPIEISSEQWIGKIQFEEVARHDLLVLRFSADFDYYFDIPLKAGWQDPSELTPYLQGLPMFQSWTPSKKIEWPLGRPVYVSRYVEDFDPAEAPMSEMGALAPVVLEDSAFYMPDSLALEDYRFYFFHEDSATDVGMTLLKVPAYFPKFRLIGELIGPMRYITTDAEYEELIETNRPKRTFDEFWINTYGTKFRARNAIRRFFQKVEQANELFTHYKVGWKTDRGMIFIVYGPPLEVYRSDKGEIWVYEDISFEFLKVNTLFSTIYPLKKDRSYEPAWYQQVGRIRKGE